MKKKKKQTDKQTNKQKRQGKDVNAQGQKKKLRKQDKLLHARTCSNEATYLSENTLADTTWPF